jgi:hypothetical protein
VNANGRDWIIASIRKACRPRRVVTNAVLKKIYNLLRGELSQHQLSATALTSIAKALISDMVPAVPKKTETKE